MSLLVMLGWGIALVVFLGVLYDLSAKRAREKARDRGVADDPRFD